MVVKGTTGCLLSGQTSIDLNFLTVKVNNVKTKSTFTKLASQEKVSPRLQPMVTKCDKVFHGVGKLTDVQVHLHINKEIKPVVQPTRRIPFAIRKKVESELVRLQKEDIIEPAKGPSLWVSPIVAFPKPNNPEQIRLCIDMRQPNTAIQRERHPQPTIDDLIHDLNGARHFSKLDLSSAYHQPELDEESRQITTFTTHKGLFQYKRLNFGTNSASEIFQHTIQGVFNGISGCRNINDDIIVFGKTQNEHDKTLEMILQVAEQRNLKFNFAKCQFDQTQLEFFGYIFSADGISPSANKVQATKDASVPKNASEAFENLKHVLTTETTMAYFDSSKNTELYVDASPFGLGAILTQTTPGQQDTKVIAYASRSLTDTESRYSQIERESLAIVYGIEYFHIYLYGHEFTLITDHKQLELI